MDLQAYEFTAYLMHVRLQSAPLLSKLILLVCVQPETVPKW